MEVWDAQMESSRRSDNIDARWRENSLAYDRRIDAVKRATGADIVNPYHSPVGSTSAVFGVDDGNEADPFKFFQDELKKVQEKYPHLADVIKADIDPTTDVEWRQKEAAEAAASAYERGGWLAPIASLGGAVNASFYDPINVLTMPIGPMSAARTGAIGIVEMGVKNGLANAGVELAVQPVVRQWKKDGGIDHTLSDMALNVGAAFIFGAGLDMGVRGAYRGFQSYRGMVPILDSDGGVIGYRKPKDIVAPPKVDIPDATIEKIVRNDPAAIREVLEQTGELNDNPVLRGALQDLERVTDHQNTVNRLSDAAGVDRRDGDFALINMIRALDDTEPMPVRTPEPVRPVEDAVSYVLDATGRHGAKLDDVAAEVLKDAGLAADPRLKAVIDLAMGGELPELLPAIRAAVADLDAGKDAPEAAKSFVGSLMDVFATTPVDRIAAKTALLRQRDPILAARMARDNPGIIDGSFPLGNEFWQGVRLLTDLAPRAFEMVERAEVSPGVARVVADFVPDHLHTSVLRDLVDAGITSPAAARAMIPELLPGPPDEVFDALAGRTLPRTDRAAGLRNGAEVDEPAGKAAQANLERMQRELHQEIAEARALPPEAPPMPDPAIVRAGEIAKAIDAVRRVAPAGTEFRTFSTLSDLPENLRASVEKANAEIDALFDPVSRSVWLSTAAMNPSGRLHHEVVHALKADGLLTDGEVRLLANRAGKIDDLGFDRAKYEAAYRDRYSEDGLRLALDEEAAAHLIEARVRGADFGAEINGIADRIAQFFERIRNALQGLGFKTADDVMNAILSGEVARRKAVQDFMVKEDLTAFAATPSTMFAFAGERAKTADLEALALAKRLELDGMSRDEIWTKTGWGRGVDGKWRFEIDDSGMKMTAPTTRGGALEPLSSTLQMGGLVDHQELLKAYPELARLKVNQYSNLTGRGIGSHYWPNQNPEKRSINIAHDRTRPQWRNADRQADPNEVMMNTNGPYSLRSTAAHELQHALQEIDGELPPTGLGGAVYRSAPEVEARTVEKRMDMTAAERRARPFWYDYDVPEDQQIVRFRSGQQNSEPMFAMGTILENERTPEALGFRPEQVATEAMVERFRALLKEQRDLEDRLGPASSTLRDYRYNVDAAMGNNAKWLQILPRNKQYLDIASALEDPSVIAAANRLKEVRSETMKLDRELQKSSIIDRVIEAASEPRPADTEMRVYHGTDATFTTYSAEIAKAASGQGNDIAFVTPTKEFASNFGSTIKKLTLRPGYYFDPWEARDLARLAPYINRQPNADRIWRALDETVGNTWGHLENPETVAELKRLGYDGVRMQEDYYSKGNVKKTALTFAIWTRGKLDYSDAPGTMFAMRRDDIDPDTIPRLIEPYVAAYPRLAALAGNDLPAIMARLAEDGDAITEARQALSDAVGPETAAQIETTVMRALMDGDVSDLPAIARRVMDEIMPEDQAPRMAANDNTSEAAGFRRALDDADQTTEMQMLVEACR